MNTQAYIQQTQNRYVKPISIIKNKFKSTRLSCNINRRKNLHASLTVTGRIFSFNKTYKAEFLMIRNSMINFMVLALLVWSLLMSKVLKNIYKI